MTSDLLCAIAKPSAPTGRIEYNLWLNSIQAKANKNKQNRFHLLSFIFPNRGFSMGYNRFQIKKPTGVSGCVQNVSCGCATPFSPYQTPAKARV